MVAMRVFTVEEFTENLENHLGLTRTESTTNNGCFWRRPSGQCIHISNYEHMDSIPDHFLDEIYKQIKRLEVK